MSKTTQSTNGTATEKNAEVKPTNGVSTPISNQKKTIAEIKKQTEKRSMIMEQLSQMEESKAKLQSIILACNGNGESITIRTGKNVEFSIKNPLLVKKFGHDIDVHITASVEKLEQDLEAA